jgi:hypothetical protein
MIRKFFRLIEAVFMIVVTVLLSPWLGDPPNGEDWDN